MGIVERVASRHLQAQERLNLIAAVSADRLLGVQDALNRKYLQPHVWPAARRGLYFELWMLRRVPIRLGEHLADVGTPAGKLNPKMAWQMARRFANSEPFARHAVARAR